MFGDASGMLTCASCGQQKRNMGNTTYELVYRKQDRNF